MMPGTIVPPSVHGSSRNHESSDEDLVGLLPFFDEGHVTGSGSTPDSKNDPDQINVTYTEDQPAISSVRHQNIWDI